MSKRKKKGNGKLDTTVGKAMEAALRPRVRAVLVLEEAVRAGDVEAVHDMRVATKRLREAARLFRPAVGKARMARHLAHLERLNDTLGIARELDVLGLSVEDLGARSDGLAERLAPLRERLAQDRAAADSQLLPVLDETLPFLEGDFEALFRDRTKKRAAVWDMPFPSLCAQAVEKRLAQMTALEPAAREPNAVEALHRLRIAVKRVKYALELSLEVFGKPAKKAYKLIAELQELLGLVHDCDVLAGVLNASAGSIVTRQAAKMAASLVAEDRERHRAAALALLDDIHGRGVLEDLQRSLKRHAVAAS